jgi:hypothetical protein
VHDEFVVAVLVEALQGGAVAAHAMHARSGVTGKFDPLRLERVELRVDDGAGERDDGGCGSVKAGDDEAAGGGGATSACKGSGEPAAIGTNGRLTELGAGQREDAARRESGARDGPQFPAPRDHKGCAIGVQRGGIRMDGSVEGELARFTGGERDLEQLRFAGAVTGEEHFAIAREERALQKVGGVIDVRAAGDLADHARAR